jgi:hypothetical protein
LKNEPLFVPLNESIVEDADIEWFGDRIVAPKQPSPATQAAPDNKPDFL